MPEYPLIYGSSGTAIIGTGLELIPSRELSQYKTVIFTLKNTTGQALTGTIYGSPDNSNWEVLTPSPSVFAPLANAGFASGAITGGRKYYKMLGTGTGTTALSWWINAASY